jgi:hypothetical protein
MKPSRSAAPGGAGGRGGASAAALLPRMMCTGCRPCRARAKAPAAVSRSKTRLLTQVTAAGMCDSARRGAEATRHSAHGVAQLPLPGRHIVLRGQAA